MALTLVLGGIRSGKSHFAEQLVRDSPVYVATAQPMDDEMRRRIDRHQLRRPPHWPVLEATTGVAEALRGQHPVAATVLLDGFGMVVGAALDKPDPFLAVRAEVDAIVADAVRRDWIVVSDETGLSLVSEYPAGRMFQDLLGEANQWLAAAAVDVYLVVAGRALPLAAPNRLQR